MEAKTENWIAALENFGRPPPRKLWNGSNDLLGRDAYGALETDPTAVVNSPLFMDKVRRFQASGAHPYAQANVQVSQKLASTGGVGGFGSSELAEAKRSRISRDEAAALTAHVRAHTRPHNPWAAEQLPPPEGRNYTLPASVGATSPGGASSSATSAYSSYSSVGDKSSDASSNNERKAPPPPPPPPPPPQLDGGKSTPPPLRLKTKGVSIKELRRPAESSPRLASPKAPKPPPIPTAPREEPRLEPSVPLKVDVPRPSLEPEYSDMLAEFDSASAALGGAGSPSSSRSTPARPDFLPFEARTPSPVAHAAAADARYRFGPRISARLPPPQPKKMEAPIFPVVPKPAPTARQRSASGSGGLGPHELDSAFAAFEETLASSLRDVQAMAAVDLRVPDSPRKEPQQQRQPHQPQTKPAAKQMRHQESLEMSEMGRRGLLQSEMKQGQLFVNGDRRRDKIVDRIPAAELHIPTPPLFRHAGRASHNSSALSTRSSSTGSIGPAQPHPPATIRNGTRPTLGPVAAEKQAARFEELTRRLSAEFSLSSSKLNSIGTCGACGDGIRSSAEAVQPDNRLLHARCFVCLTCGRQLKGKKFYVAAGGGTYCEEDFLYSGFQETTQRCAVCGHFIMEMILQAVGESFHPGCFRCSECGVSLDGVAFSRDEASGRVLCVPDFQRLCAPRCAACDLPITPQPGSEETVRVVAMNKDYHVDCYVCEGCGLSLTDEPERRCFPLDAHLLCRRCHSAWAKTQPSPITDL